MYIFIGIAGLLGNPIGLFSSFTLHSTEDRERRLAAHEQVSLVEADFVERGTYPGSLSLVELNDPQF